MTADSPTVSVDQAGIPIRFFISSTFADFQVERTVLQERVFPVLRTFCAEQGFRLQPIDLRWGVSDEAGTDRQTLTICFDELERCRTLSPDCFLLILLGDRYGTHILPPTIPVVVVTRLLAFCSEQERATFASAYQLDENAIPPEYALLRANGPERVEDEELRQLLVRATRAAGLTENERLPFEASATQREIQRGLLDLPRGSGYERGVLCAVRQFTGEPRGAETRQYLDENQDRAALARMLTAAGLERLPASQILRYRVEWSSKRGPRFDAAAIAERYMRLLRLRLEEVMAARISARASAHASAGTGSSGSSDTAATAYETNEAIASGHTGPIEGRDDELARVETYLTGEEDEQSARLPLVVTGPPGSGKSAILTEAAARVVQRHPDTAVITRYIGVTPDTSNLLEFLNSLRRAIALADDQPEPIALRDEATLVSAVATSLSARKVPAVPDAQEARHQRPLLVIVDALEQLNSTVTRIDWLPARLALGVRVVISVRQDSPGMVLLQNQNQLIPTVQVLILAPLTVAAGRAILRRQLSAAPPRTLTSAQEAAILTAFEAQGLPLSLHLLAAVAHRWRSFDAPRLGERSTLPETADEVMRAILEQLEAPGRHGRLLVERALDDLAVARYGLAADELLDLQARDDAVRAAQKQLSPNSPPIDPRLPLPTAIWARLFADVDSLLIEREAGAASTRVLHFYHQQLRAAAEARYLDGPARVDRHRALAAYFGEQPWHLGPSQWNWRKVDELVTQLRSAQDHSGAEQALSQLATDLERSADLNTDTQRADPEDVISLITALASDIQLGAYARVGERFSLQGLRAFRELGDRPAQGRVLGSLGQSEALLGRVAEASDYYKQALTILQAEGATVDEGMVLNSLGLWAAGQGHLDEASDYFEQAIYKMFETRDRSIEPGALTGMGLVAQGRGQFQKAAACFKDALAIVREAGDRAGEGRLLNNLATLAAVQDHRDEARGYFEQALAILQAVGDRAGECTLLSNIGAVAASQGRLVEGMKYLNQALTLTRTIGMPSAEALVLNTMGALYTNMRLAALAVPAYEQALALERASGNEYAEAMTLQNLADLADVLGKRKDCVRLYQQSLAIYDKQGFTREAENIEGRLAWAERFGYTKSRRGLWPFRRK